MRKQYYRAFHSYISRGLKPYKCSICRQNGKHNAYYEIEELWAHKKRMHQK
jgi:hypothetical protein